MTSSSPEDETRQDIKRSRQQLSDTVEALAHKADVSARVKDKLADTQQTVQVQAEAATQDLLEGTAALQAKAGEVARHAEHLICQALGQAPTAGGRTHRPADSQGETTTADRCGGCGRDAVGAATPAPEQQVTAMLKDTG